MDDALTTITLVILTLVSIAACALAAMRFTRRGRDGRYHSQQRWLTLVCAVGCAAVFVYRALVVHQDWQPLEAHVDGLVLIASFMATTILFLHARSQTPGLSVFALPVLTVILAWSVCASAWTFHPFEIGSVWKAVHRVAVYLGTLFVCLAGAAGSMYLYAQHQLRHKQLPTGQTPIASLEAIETLIIRAAALAFALLSLGLVMGLIIATSGPTKLGPGWWYSWKVVLAGAVWLIYAIVMNVRYATRFRGARAAWLSILALAIIFVIFGIVLAWPQTDTTNNPRSISTDLSIPKDTTPNVSIPQEVP